MRVLYFSWVREKIGVGKEEICLPKSIVTVEDLAVWLRGMSQGHSEALSDLSIIRIAVNQEHVRMDHLIKGDEEVAFFPPVTGG